METKEFGRTGQTIAAGDLTMQPKCEVGYQRSVIPAHLAHAKRGAGRAQAMVEFALALPIFLLIIYGLLEVGRLIFMEAAVATASREGARYASAWGVNSSSIQQYNDCTGIRNAAKNTGFLLGLTNADIVICYDSGPGSGTDGSGVCKDRFGNFPTGQSIVGYCTGSTDTKTLSACNRIDVTVTARYQPILPLFLPLTTKNMSSTTSRTLLGLVDLNNPSICH